MSRVRGCSDVHDRLSLICFLPLFFLCYYLLPARFRNAFLLAGSHGFYAWGDPGNILLLLAASAATYGFGRAMAPSAPKVRRLG